MKQNLLIRNGLIFLVALLLCILAGMDFLDMEKSRPISAENPGLTEMVMLSKYSPGLAGTPADTEVYVFRGEKPGGSMVILGGTHPNEIAGPLNAVTFIENVKVEAGTLYVIPNANKSGFSNTAPLSGYLNRYTIQLDDGSQREFRVGARIANPIHQWPDPNYYDGASTRVLKNAEITEIRNLNRNYPGSPDGPMIEQVCYGIYNLLVTEKVDVIYDAHEAGPIFPRVDYIIAHENAMPLASSAILGANMEGLPFKADLSGFTSYGLSHRSLGNNTDTMATLFETNNPAQGSHRGKMSMELLLEGIDPNYAQLSAEGYVALDAGYLTAEGSSITQRVAYHMSMCKNLAVSLGELYPDKPLVLSGLPEYQEMMDNGVGHYLRPIS